MNLKTYNFLQSQMGSGAEGPFFYSDIFTMKIFHCDLIIFLENIEVMTSKQKPP